MDHPRPKSRLSGIKKLVALCSGGVFVLGGCLALANIDFHTPRVNRDKITIDTVRRGELEIKVSGNGELRSRHIDEIVSQVEGRVVQADVKAGDIVAAGQVIVQLTNPQLVDRADEAYSAWEGGIADLKASQAELQNSLLQQKIVVSQARFNLKRAQLRLNAEEPLMKKHIIAKLEFATAQLNVDQLTEAEHIEEDSLDKIRDNIRLELAAKQARVAVLARDLERARTEVKELKIVAGIDGIVQAINANVGQALQSGSLIGRIAKPNELYARLQIEAREAGDIRRGQRVLIDTHSGTVTGVVTRVDPSVVDGTVNVDADLTGPLPAGARAQLPIEGVVYVRQLADALYVGRPVYVRSDATIAVYELNPGGRYASRVYIHTGMLSTSYVQVAAGLATGDRIITSDTSGWQDKKRILID